MVTMEPRRVKYPLGSLSHIDARSIGEPGHRTFQLALEAGRATCSVWLEKEQLLQLGIYLQDVVRSLSPEDRKRRGEPKEPEWAGQAAAIDFKAGQLLLSHDPKTSSFYLLAYEREETEPAEESASVSFWITADQAERLAEESLRICAAGRPPCFLCGLPINPEGHVCPRSNGHTVFEAG
ncbi:MAG: DUF3090 family protein [Chloroflexota bacterium]